MGERLLILMNIFSCQEKFKCKKIKGKSAMKKVGSRQKEKKVGSLQYDRYSNLSTLGTS